MEWTDEQILEQVQRIKYLYKMKGVFRYGRNRDPWARAESNAEHLYGMMVLVNFFLPLEDPDGVLDRQRIMDLIMVHDIDEIENGDIISYQKTDADREREKQSMQVALDSIPQDMSVDYQAVVDEYEAQETIEARFTKAIDKIEPLFEVFDKYGKEIMLNNKTTYEQAMRGKQPFIDQFPIMARYAEVIAQEMQKQGYFYESDS